MSTGGGGRRHGGGAAHVFLAVALALPVVLVGAALVGAARAPGQSALNTGLLALLGVLFVAAATWAALLPGVRQVEVATARTLLGVDVPDVATPARWSSRRRGAAWLGLVVVVGTVVGTIALFVVPFGVGLVAHPWSGADTVDLPGGLGRFRTGGPTTVALVAAGVLLLVGAVAAVPGVARLLAWAAPRCLGPSAADRVALAEAREHDLARRNALAREVHDALGHALTAMTLQAGAARRLLRTDPERADRALAEVEGLGRRAQADVDAVVGALRSSSSPAGGAPTDLRDTLAPLVAGSAVEVDLRAPAAVVVDAERARVAYRTVQEALTNAARHGTGPASVTVAARRDAVEIEVANAVPEPAAAVATDRRGLTGLRERMLLVGGEVSTRTEGGRWILTARFPR